MRSLAHVVARRVANVLFAGALGTVGSACQKVNCENLCERIIQCEVSFAPSDDPELAQVASGARTELESCALGCEENPAANVDNAICVDAVTDADTDPASCQDAVLTCFEAQVVDAP